MIEDYEKMIETKYKQLVEKVYTLKAAKAFMRHHRHRGGLQCKACGHHHKNIFDSIIDGDTGAVRYYEINGVTNFEVKCLCPSSEKSFNKSFNLVAVLMNSDPFTDEPKVLGKDVTAEPSTTYVWIGDYILPKKGVRAISLYDEWWLLQEDGKSDKVVSKEVVEKLSSSARRDLPKKNKGNSNHGGKS